MTISMISKCRALIVIAVCTIHKTYNHLWFIVFVAFVRPYGDVSNCSKFAYVVQVFVFQTKIIPYVPSIN